MGNMAMGDCEDRQRKSCIAQIDCKHFQGGYERLQLGNVYTCHGFLQRTCELEEVDKTFFHKLIEQFVNRGFGNTLQLSINIIHETSNIIVCNSKQQTWVP